MIKSDGWPDMDEYDAVAPKWECWGLKQDDMRTVTGAGSHGGGLY